MNSQELVVKLKSQHRMLQADLSLALKKVETEEKIKGEEIVLSLEKFKSDLLEHLKSESEEFYPDYMDKKIKRGEEVESTKKFIGMMDEIGVVVMKFLEKYSLPKTVESAPLDLKKELSEIVSTLNTRIETEEEGVFGIYLIM